MRIGRILILALTVGLGAACASPEEIRRPCCYEGDLTLAHLERVRFGLKDGSELPFDQVFVGFEPQIRDVPTPFPFQKIGISGLVYDVLSVVFPNYDANANGILEDAEGRDLNLTLLVDPDKQYMARLAELVEDYLESIGIEIDLRAVERSSWVNLKDTYRYDLTISRTSPWGMVMHANWGTGYFDTRRSGEGVLHTVD